MRICLLAFLMFGVSPPAHAIAPQSPGSPASPASLRERLLRVVAADPGARPAGQCIFTCGDQMVKVVRCANGDCPDYDCKTGIAACPTR